MIWGEKSCYDGYCRDGYTAVHLLIPRYGGDTVIVAALVHTDAHTHAHTHREALFNDGHKSSPNPIHTHSKKAMLLLLTLSLSCKNTEPFNRTHTQSVSDRFTSTQI